MVTYSWKSEQDSNINLTRYTKSFFEKFSASKYRCLYLLFTNPSLFALYSLIMCPCTKLMGIVLNSRQALLKPRSTN